jgi:hypothetical protein
MIISPGRGYIFVHIPKTGGTAMAVALEARAMKDDILIGDTPKAKRRKNRIKDVTTAGRLWKHSTLRDIPGLVTLELIRDSFVFTLVRNPWDRMVSYYHWLQAQTFDHPVVPLARDLCFTDFVAHPTVQAGLRANPVFHYVTLPDGREHCAAFVRLEHLEQDLAPVEAHLGFSLSDMPHVNQSNRDAEYRDYYSDSARSLISDLFQAEIARFGYLF